MPDVLAKNIESLCAKKGITINAMLKNCSLPSSTFRNITMGSKPSFDKVEKIADYFGVSVDYLLGRTDEPQPPAELPVALHAPKGYDKLTDEERMFIDEMIKKYTENR